MAFPFDPEPSTLWSLQRDDKLASCAVRFVPNGVEVKVVRNGNLLWSRIFENGDDALREAEEERERTVSEGWIEHVTI